MVDALRKLLAVLSTIGLIASVAAYVGSFFGLTTGPVSNARTWIFILFVGVFVTGIPFSFAQYQFPLSDQKMYSQRLAEEEPRWKLRAIHLSAAFAAVHFVLFLFLTRASALDIVDGQYVLRGHGIISQPEYVMLDGWGTRYFASFMICIYLYMTLYWSSSRVITAKPNPYDDYY